MNIIACISIMKTHSVHGKNKIKAYQKIAD